MSLKKLKESDSIGHRSITPTLSVQSRKSWMSRKRSDSVSWFKSEQEVQSDASEKKRVSGSHSHNITIKFVAIIQSILVIGLIGYWIHLMSTGGTFSTESDYPDDNQKELRDLEQIADNQRVTSSLKKRKIQLLFYSFTLVTANLIIFANALLIFDKKNKMAACLLWLFVNFFWIFICMAQIARAAYNWQEIHAMSSEAQGTALFQQTNVELIIIITFYSILLSVGIAFSKIVKTRFLHLRKEAKSAQHSAARKCIQNLKNRKKNRFRQKEMFYEREEEEEKLKNNSQTAGIGNEN